MNIAKDVSGFLCSLVCHLNRKTKNWKNKSTNIHCPFIINCDINVEQAFQAVAISGSGLRGAAVSAPRK